MLSTLTKLADILFEEKMITKVTIELTSGKKIKLTSSEAQELRQQLNDIYGSYWSPINEDPWKIIGNTSGAAADPWKIDPITTSSSNITYMHAKNNG